LYYFAGDPLALPSFPTRRSSDLGPQNRRLQSGGGRRCARARDGRPCADACREIPAGDLPRETYATRGGRPFTRGRADDRARTAEIGRASCRERVESAVGAATVKN